MRIKKKYCGVSPWSLGSEPINPTISVSQHGYADLGTPPQGHSVVDTDPATDGDRSYIIPGSYTNDNTNDIDHPQRLPYISPSSSSSPRQNEKIFHHYPSREMKKLLFSFFLFVEKICSIHSIVKNLYK